MHRPASAALATLALLTCSSSWSQERPGASVRLAPGVGVATGVYEFRGLSNPGYGVPVGPISLDTRLTGPVASLGLGFDWWFSKRFALGAELGGSSYDPFVVSLLANVKLM